MGYEASPSLEEDPVTVSMRFLKKIQADAVSFCRSIGGKPEPLFDIYYGEVSAIVDCFVPPETFDRKLGEMVNFIKEKDGELRKFLKEREYKNIQRFVSLTFLSFPPDKRNLDYTLIVGRGDRDKLAVVGTVIQTPFPITYVRHCMPEKGGYYECMKSLEPEEDVGPVIDDLVDRLNEIRRLGRRIEELRKGIR